MSSRPASRSSDPVMPFSSGASSSTSTNLRPQHLPESLSSIPTSLSEQTPKMMDTVMGLDYSLAEEEEEEEGKERKEGGLPTDQGEIEGQEEPEDKAAQDKTSNSTREDLGQEQELEPEQERHDEEKRNPSPELNPIPEDNLPSTSNSHHYHSNSHSHHLRQTSSPSATATTPATRLRSRSHSNSISQFQSQSRPSSPTASTSSQTRRHRSLSQQQQQHSSSSSFPPTAITKPPSNSNSSSSSKKSNSRFSSSTSKNPSMMIKRGPPNPNLEVEIEIVPPPVPLQAQATVHQTTTSTSTSTSGKTDHKKSPTGAKTSNPFSGRSKSTDTTTTYPKSSLTKRKQSGGGSSGSGSGGGSGVARRAQTFSQGRASTTDFSFGGVGKGLGGRRRMSGSGMTTGGGRPSGTTSAGAGPSSGPNADVVGNAGASDGMEGMKFTAKGWIEWEQQSGENKYKGKEKGETGEGGDDDDQEYEKNKEKEKGKEHEEERQKQQSRRVIILDISDEEEVQNESEQEGMYETGDDPSATKGRQRRSPRKSNKKEISKKPVGNGGKGKTKTQAQSSTTPKTPSRKRSTRDPSSSSQPNNSQPPLTSPLLSPLSPTMPQASSSRSLRSQSSLSPIGPNPAFLPESSLPLHPSAIPGESSSSIFGAKGGGFLEASELGTGTDFPGPMAGRTTSAVLGLEGIDVHNKNSNSEVNQDGSNSIMPEITSDVDLGTAQHHLDGNERADNISDESTSQPLPPSLPTLNTATVEALPSAIKRVPNSNEDHNYLAPSSSLSLLTEPESSSEEEEGNPSPQQERVKGKEGKSEGRPSPRKPRPPTVGDGTLSNKNRRRVPARSRGQKPQSQRPSQDDDAVDIIVPQTPESSTTSSSQRRVSLPKDYFAPPRSTLTKYDRQPAFPSYPHLSRPQGEGYEAANMDVANEIDGEGDEFMLDDDDEAEEPTMTLNTPMTNSNLSLIAGQDEVESVSGTKSQPITTATTTTGRSFPNDKTNKSKKNSATTVDGPNGTPRTRQTSSQKKGASTRPSRKRPSNSKYGWGGSRPSKKGTTMEEWEKEKKMKGLIVDNQESAGNGNVKTLSAGRSNTRPKRNVSGNAGSDKNRRSSGNRERPNRKRRISSTPLSDELEGGPRPDGPNGKDTKTSRPRRNRRAPSRWNDRASEDEGEYPDEEVANGNRNAPPVREAEPETEEQKVERERREKEKAEKEEEQALRERVWEGLKEEYHDIIIQLPLEVRRSYQLMKDMEDRMQEAEKSVKDGLLELVGLREILRGGKTRQENKKHATVGSGRSGAGKTPADATDNVHAQGTAGSNPQQGVLPNEDAVTTTTPPPAQIQVSPFEDVTIAATTSAPDNGGNVAPVTLSIGTTSPEPLPKRSKSPLHRSLSPISPRRNPPRNGSPVPSPSQRHPRSRLATQSNEGRDEDNQGLNTLQHEELSSFPFPPSEHPQKPQQATSALSALDLLAVVAESSPHSPARANKQNAAGGNSSPSARATRSKTSSPTRSVPEGVIGKRKRDENDGENQQDITSRSQSFTPSITSTAFNQSTDTSVLTPVPTSQNLLTAPQPQTSSLLNQTSLASTASFMTADPGSSYPQYKPVSQNDNNLSESNSCQGSNSVPTGTLLNTEQQKSDDQEKMKKRKLEVLKRKREVKRRVARDSRAAVRFGEDKVAQAKGVVDWVDRHLRRCLSDIHRFEEQNRPTAPPPNATTTAQVAQAVTRTDNPQTPAVSTQPITRFTFTGTRDYGSGLGKASVTPTTNGPQLGQGISGLGLTSDELDLIGLGKGGIGGGRKDYLHRPVGSFATHDRVKEPLSQRSGLRKRGRDGKTVPGENEPSNDGDRHGGESGIEDGERPLVGIGSGKGKNLLGAKGPKGSRNIRGESRRKFRGSRRKAPKGRSKSKGMISENGEPDLMTTVLDRDLYCYCRKGDYGMMIACENEECPIEWFHLLCVGLKEEPREDQPWWCPSCLPFKGKIIEDGDRGGDVSGSGIEGEDEDQAQNAPPKKRSRRTRY